MFPLQKCRAMSAKRSRHNTLAIKAAMVMRGITLTDVAKRMGVRVSTVSNVIAGRRTSKRIVNYIMRSIGRPIEVHK